MKGAAKPKSGAKSANRLQLARAADEAAKREAVAKAKARTAKLKFKVVRRAFKQARKAAKKAAKLAKHAREEFEALKIRAPRPVKRKAAGMKKARKTKVADKKPQAMAAGAQASRRATPAAPALFAPSPPPSTAFPRSQA